MKFMYCLVNWPIFFSLSRNISPISPFKGLTKKSTMNRVCILLFLAVTTLAACSPDDDVNCDGDPQSAIYLPANDSSWWAYSVSRVDTSGTRQLIGRDTLRVIGEMESDGEVYTQYVGSLLLYSNNPPEFLVRDSAHHLVYGNGDLMLPYLNFTDTFNVMNYGNDIIRFDKLVADVEPTVTPAGTFATIDFRGTVFTPLAVCSDGVAYMHSQFAENVGLVRSTYWYSSQGGCIYYERLLESYHIE